MYEVLASSWGKSRGASKCGMRTMDN